MPICWSNIFLVLESGPSLSSLRVRPFVLHLPLILNNNSYKSNINSNNNSNRNSNSNRNDNSNSNSNIPLSARLSPTPTSHPTAAA